MKIFTSRKIPAASFLLMVFAASYSVLPHETDITGPTPPRRSQKISSIARGENRPVRSTNKVMTLPPLPAGVTELKFSEIYRQPVGPRGLEYSDKARTLDGKRVRILGYMVGQAESLSSRFLFAAVPAIVNEKEYGFAEDLPPHAIHVIVAARQKENFERVEFTPGLLLLTGILSLGQQNEEDGRVSHARLTLDSVAGSSPDNTPTAD